MSVTEIINELPKLTEKERRAVRAKLQALAAEDEGVNSGGKTVTQPKTSGKKITSLPDFRARVKKIFPRPIPQEVADMVDRLIAGE